MNLKKSLISLFVVGTLSACGGSDSSSSDSSGSEEGAQTGVFLDNEVVGINYKTESQKGTTNAKGEYKFKAGESVTFSIGNLTLPEAKALTVITPRDMGNADVSTRIVQVLQSLDSDGIASNGITINDAVHTAASGLGHLDFASDTFLTDHAAHITKLMVASETPKTALVSATEANAHLDATIAGNLPKKFTTAWLANRTLYALYFEEGHGVVEKAVFNSDATKVVISNILRGEEPGTYPVTINADGYLLDGDNKGERIACGSTKDYIQTHYIVAGLFESADRWYFDKETAVSYAEGLSAAIPIAQCEKDAKKISIPHTVEDLNGRAMYGVWFDDEDNDGNSIIETAIIIKESYLNNKANVEVLYGHDVGFTISTGFTVENELLTYAIDKEDHPSVTQGSKIICSNTQYYKAHWMENGAEDGVDYWFFDEFSARSYVNNLEEDDNLVNADTACVEQP